MATLTNAALRIYSPAHMNEESASSQQSLERILREHFGLTIEPSDALWTRVADQHKRWLRKRIRGF
jgi:arylamine N-acetyltransferase